MDNKAYIGEQFDQFPVKARDSTASADGQQQNGDPSTEQGSEVPREKWGKSIEFLLSCVALSVGFGNVWRFPYTALKNGGGAFLIPYLIVLFVVGRPLYYLEMILGQFSSLGHIKVFNVSPLMRGVGIGQTLAFFAQAGYYAALLSISVRYFLVSFQNPLPWSVCPEDAVGCVNSNSIEPSTGNQTVLSADLYFTNTITKAVENLDNGIGVPDWKLALCLFGCWSTITAILVKGVKSSGKASYFLAIFPYVILLILLGRACTLEGAMVGIKHFFNPDWSRLLDQQVWFAAVTQCFFSLTIGFGAVIVFASFNNFSNNIYRDAMIISWLDTFTSILSGVIVFGIVGNVAHITGKDVTEVIKAGPGLTFVTYPDAIAKMQFAPNFFAVAFFLMFTLLGLGSNVGIAQTIVTAIRDQYPRLDMWKVVVGVSIAGFCCGLLYITPAGLIMLELIDFYGVLLASLSLVILESVTFCWIYSVSRLCHDIKFMLGIKTGIFWRVCWGFVTPIIILAVFIMQLVETSRKPLSVPTGYNVFGWCLYVFIVLQVVGWGIYTVLKQPEKRVYSKMASAIKPAENWGPAEVCQKQEYDVAMQQYWSSRVGGGNIIARAYRRVFK